MTIGNAPMTPAADIESLSVSMRPIRVAVPRDMVMARGLAVRASANRNSLKVKMTAKMAVAAIPGGGQRQSDAAEGSEAPVAVDLLEIDGDLKLIR